MPRCNTRHMEHNVPWSLKCHFKMSLQILPSESLASINVPHEKIRVWTENFNSDIIGGISSMLYSSHCSGYCRSLCDFNQSTQVECIDLCDYINVQSDFWCLNSDVVTSHQISRLGKKTHTYRAGHSQTEYFQPSQGTNLKNIQWGNMKTSKPNKITSSSYVSYAYWNHKNEWLAFSVDEQQMTVNM